MSNQNISHLLDQYSKYFKFKTVAKLRSVNIQKNIFRQLFDGGLQISSPSEHIQLVKQKHLNQYQNQQKQYFHLENASLFQFFVQFQQFNKKDIPLKQRKKKKHELEEQENKRKMKLYLQKMKIWNQQKEQISIKKTKQNQKKQKESRMIEQNKLLEQKKIQEITKLQKQKKIEEGLQQIDERRKKRLQMIKQSAIQRHKSLNQLDKAPNYFKIQQAYLQKQRKKQQEAQLQNKIKRQQLLRQQQEVKAHQKAYIQKIKQKLGSKPKDQSPPSTERKVKSDFVKFLNKDQFQLQKSKQKVSRVKQFEERIRSIPILIDTQKRKEIQIKIDKHKHSRKYIILQGKALNDDQIYKQFQDFQIEVDPKTFGKKYLEQLKVIPKKERLSKSNSISTMPPINQKPIYRNYLQDIKLKKKSVQQPFRTQEQKITSVLQKSKKQGNYGQKKYQIEKKITEKIAQYQKTVMKKVQQMKNMTKYDESLRKESQIDELYSKLVQSKLVSLNLG